VVFPAVQAKAWLLFDQARPRSRRIMWGHSPNLRTPNLRDARTLDAMFARNRVGQHRQPARGPEAVANMRRISCSGHQGDSGLGIAIWIGSVTMDGSKGRISYLHDPRAASGIAGIAMTILEGVDWRRVAGVIIWLHPPTMRRSIAPNGKRLYCASDCVSPLAWCWIGHGLRSGSPRYFRKRSHPLPAISAGANQQGQELTVADLSPPRQSAFP